MNKIASLIFIFLFINRCNAQSIQITGNNGYSGNIIIGQSNYHVSESIYTDNEIGSTNFISQSKAINRIGYLISPNSVVQTGQVELINNYNVWMKNVSSTTKTFSNGVYTKTGYTLVYSGTIEVPETGEVFINLSTPFVRIPGTNLQVLIERKDGILHPGYVFFAAVGNDISSASNSSRRVNTTTLSTTLTATIFRPAIDLIHVNSFDASIVGFENPYASCFDADQTIGVKVSNFGLNIIPAGALSVSLNIVGANSYNGTATNLADIQPGDSTFLYYTGISLINPGENTETAVIQYADDANHTNDSLSSIIRTSPILTAFPIDDDAESNTVSVFWETKPINNRISYWSVHQGPYKNSENLDSILPLNMSNNSFLFDSYNAPTGSQGRLYSKCIALPSSSVPKISFWIVSAP